MDINDLINPVDAPTRVPQHQSRDDDEAAESLLLLSGDPRDFSDHYEENSKESEPSASPVSTSKARESTHEQEIGSEAESSPPRRLIVRLAVPNMQASSPAQTSRRPVPANTHSSPSASVPRRSARTNTYSSPSARIPSRPVRPDTQESPPARGLTGRTRPEAKSSPQARVSSQPARAEAHASPARIPSQAARPNTQSPPSRFPLQPTGREIQSSPARVPQVSTQTASPCTEATPPSRAPTQKARSDGQGSPSALVPTELARAETTSSPRAPIPAHTARPHTQTTPPSRESTQPARPNAQSSPATPHVQAEVQRPRPGQITIEHALIPSEQALQAHLIRQQIIAGIPPEQITHMRRLRYSGQPRIPGLVQITNEGVVIPEIPPAQFRGIFHPLPGARQSNAEIMRNGPHPPERSDSAPGPRPDEQGNTQRRSPRIARPGNDQPTRPPVTPPRRPAPTAPPANRRRSSGGRRISRRDLRTRAQTETESNEKEFSIIESLAKYPEICLEVIGYLDPSSLVKTYSISKSFYMFVNGHFQDAIMNVASRCAPESALLYPGRCYPRLCVNLPQTGKVPRSRPHFRTLPDKVPSIRWLQMIDYREKVTDAILAALEKEGHDLPPRCSLIIKKLWFLMDIPENIRREWTVQNMNIWPDVDIYLAVLFLIKLEKYLQGIYDHKCNPLRRLLLARPSMTLLHDTLCKDALKSDFDIHREYIRWKYMPLPYEVDTSVFNVRPTEIGMFQFEGYGKKGRNALFKTPDELILREALDRNLDMEQIHVDYFFQDDRIPFSYRGSQGGGMEPSWVEEIEKDGRGKNMNRLDVVVIE